MHKLAKGLKKKKKGKKGKKGEEDEFDPEELERYRRERAEAQQKAEESGDGNEAGKAGNAGSDEWRKFEALTAGVDSILKKTQGDLDRIKSTSFFQRKPAFEEPKPEEVDSSAEKAASSKRWIGFDKDGNPIEGVEPTAEEASKKDKPLVSEDGFVEVPDDEEEQEDSAEEDIFDTTYIDVLQNIDVQLAYIPDSPTEEELGDDPFDTTNADKVLKTVDKKGNKLVSLGNAVEVLAGRIDYVSSCKLTKSGRRPRTQTDLLLDDFEEVERPATEAAASEPVSVEKTLLDDDSDLPDIPVDLTKPPPVLPRPVTPVEPSETEIVTNNDKTTTNGPLDLSEFDVLKDKTILAEIPDLDDSEFDLTDAAPEPLRLPEEEDPFSAKEPETVDFQSEIIEASFEAATFVDEDDPFDTTFASNILPGKTELKFIEKELEELPVSEVSISLTDPAGHHRDYETGLLTNKHNDALLGFLPQKRDLLGGSTTDLSQLADQPIAPEEELTYVDPFDTSAVQDLPPGKTELKFIEKELLGEQTKVVELDDDDFDPRKEEVKTTPAPPRPSAPPVAPQPVFKVNFEEAEKEEALEKASQESNRERKASRPEALALGPTKVVAFELPTPSNRPDLLKTSEEEKTLPSKPLTPYYSQKSLEEVLPIDEEEVEVDPFDTSFVTKAAPGKTELKLIESELLKEETKLPHSASDQDFDPKTVIASTRRQSDFTATTFRPHTLKLAERRASLVEKVKEQIAQQSVPKREFKKQESLLDAEVEVDAKPLTPRVETKPIEEEELSYADPFDTSIATNILPGKAELKVLENELEQIVEQPPVIRTNPINLVTAVASTVPEIDDFDPRAEEQPQTKDYLCSDVQDPGIKVLTPLHNIDFAEEDIDPFDTSFATVEPGKTELKLLESELMK